MTKIELLPALALCAVLAGRAHAMPNLLANGSFEAGGGGLAGWTTSGTQISFPPAVIVTNGVTGSAFVKPFPPTTR